MGQEGSGICKFNYCQYHPNGMDFHACIGECPNPMCIHQALKVWGPILIPCGLHIMRPKTLAHAKNKFDCRAIFEVQVWFIQSHEPEHIACVFSLCSVSRNCRTTWSKNSKPINALWRRFRILPFLSICSTLREAMNDWQVMRKRHAHNLVPKVYTPLNNGVYDIRPIW